MDKGRSYRNYAGSITDFGSDANNLYNYVEDGESIFIVGPTTINIPTSRGILKHIQRMGKGNNTVSQEITQYLYDATYHKTFQRYGNGNSLSINWTDWTEV